MVVCMLIIDAVFLVWTCIMKSMMQACKYLLVSWSRHRRLLIGFCQRKLERLGEEIKWCIFCQLTTTQHPPEKKTMKAKKKRYPNLCSYNAHVLHAFIKPVGAAMWHRNLVWLFPFFYFILFYFFFCVWGLYFDFAQPEPLSIVVTLFMVCQHELCTWSISLYLDEYSCAHNLLSKL